MNSKKILLVDDVELFLEMEKDFFRRDRFQLLVARNGEEAVEVARQEKPDLIFMDLHMPKENGDEACRRIKADPDLRFTPVVIVTNSTDQNDLEQCRQAGCDDILIKPLLRNTFLATAFRHLKVHDSDSVRVRTRLNVRYGTDQASLVNGFSIDLSAGGIFIEHDEPPAPGVEMNLEFAIPSPLTTIRCRGRIAWCNHPDWLRKGDLPFGMALQFLDLSPVARQALRDYIRGKQARPTGPL